MRTNQIRYIFAPPQLIQENEIIPECAIISHFSNIKARRCDSLGTSSPLTTSPFKPHPTLPNLNQIHFAMRALISVALIISLVTDLALGQTNGTDPDRNLLCPVSSVRCGTRCCSRLVIHHQEYCADSALSLCCLEGYVNTNGICCLPDQINCGGVCCTGICRPERIAKREEEINVPPQARKRELCQRDGCPTPIPDPIVRWICIHENRTSS